MKIYIIYASDYEYFEILGVFDNKQKAETFAEKYKMYCDKQANINVEEYTLNNLTQEATEQILNSLDEIKNELLGDK